MVRLVIDLRSVRKKVDLVIVLPVNFVVEPDAPRFNSLVPASSSKADLDVFISISRTRVVRHNLILVFLRSPAEGCTISIFTDMQVVCMINLGTPGSCDFDGLAILKIDIVEALIIMIAPTSWNIKRLSVGKEHVLDDLLALKVFDVVVESEDLGL